MINFTKIGAALLVLLAIALGIYAWWLGSRSGAPPTVAAAPLQPAVATFPVVVTSRAVPAGEALTAGTLRIAQLPINPPDALHDLPSAIGRVPVGDLGEGTPVMAAQLHSGLSLRLAEGERAVAVKADEVMGVGNRVRPGDFVDVFFVLKTEGKEIERSQARLLLSRQRVLAFGAASIDGAPAADGAGKSSPTPRPEAARTAVLAVPVEDVSRLVLGEASGHLLLALRHPGDNAVPDARLFAAMPTALKPLAGKPGGATLGPIDLAQAGLATADLASGGVPGAAPAIVATATGTGAMPSPANRPRPSGAAAARSGSNEVEVIRGDKRETVSY